MLALAVDTQVHHHPIEPSLELGSAGFPIRCLGDEPDERLLGDILGLPGIAQHVPGMAGDLAEITFHQGRPGGPVPRRRLIDQEIIVGNGGPGARGSQGAPSGGRAGVRCAADSSLISRTHRH